jgi:hypothetical protein
MKKNYRVKEKKLNKFGHILHGSYFLKHIVEGKMEGEIELTRTKGRRHKQLLDDLKETSGYCELKEETLDRTLRRTRFGRGYTPRVRLRSE